MKGEPSTVGRTWGYVAFRGVAALLFGLWILFMPPRLATLIMVFGGYAFIDGVLTIVTALRDRGRERLWVPLLVGGSLGVAIGITMFLAPGLTGTALLNLIATWAVVRGLAHIGAAIRFRKVIEGEGLIALAGVLSLAVGIGLFVFSAGGALAATPWIAAYAIVVGIVLVAYGLRLRRRGLDGLTVR